MHSEETEVRILQNAINPNDFLHYLVKHLNLAILLALIPEIVTNTILVNLKVRLCGAINKAMVKARTLVYVNLTFMKIILDTLVYSCLKLLKVYFFF